MTSPDGITGGGPNGITDTGADTARTGCRAPPDGPVDHPVRRT
jgi:hypothetical protein